MMFSFFDNGDTLGDLGRSVTLHGSGQTVTTWATEALTSFLIGELQRIGIGVSSLVVGRSWLNSLTTFDITVTALSSQTVGEVEAVVTQGFRNIAEVNDALIWNTGPFRVTSGGWQVNAGANVGGVVTLPGGPSSGQIYNAGNLATVTVHGSDNGNTAGASSSTFDTATNWLKSHETEAILMAAIFGVLLLKR